MHLWNSTCPNNAVIGAHAAELNSVSALTWTCLFISPDTSHAWQGNSPITGENKKQDQHGHTQKLRVDPKDTCGHGMFLIEDTFLINHQKVCFLIWPAGASQWLGVCVFHMNETESCLKHDIHDTGLEKNPPCQKFKKLERSLKTAFVVSNVSGLNKWKQGTSRFQNDLTSCDVHQHMVMEEIALSNRCHGRTQKTTEEFRGQRLAIACRILNMQGSHTGNISETSEPPEGKGHCLGERDPRPHHC